MKILYATDTFYPRINGVTTCILLYAKYLQKLGHEIIILAPTFPDIQFIEADYKVYRIPSTPLVFANSPEDRMVWAFQSHKVNKIIIEEMPDIVHSHTEFPLGMMALKAAKKLSIPSVASHHTYFELYLEYIHFYLPDFMHKIYFNSRYRLIARLVQKIITPSETMRNFIVQRSGKSKPVIFPTGYDDDFFYPIEDLRIKSEKLLSKTTPLRLIHIGRVALEKNLIFLLDVIEKYIQKRKISLTIVGGGPWLNELEKNIVKRNLQDITTVTGYVPYDELNTWYNKGDIFLMSSKTETQSLVVVEALACGLPVIALDAPGVNEILEDNFGGYLLQEDIDEFIKHIDLITSDKKIYEKKAKEALKRADDFSMDRLSKKMESLYTSLIGV